MERMRRKEEGVQNISTKPVDLFLRKCFHQGIKKFLLSPSRFWIKYVKLFYDR